MKKYRFDTNPNNLDSFYFIPSEILTPPSETPDHIRAIPVHLPPSEVQKDIGDKVREAERMRSKANISIGTLQDVIQDATKKKKFI